MTTRLISAHACRGDRVNEYATMNEVRIVTILWKWQEIRGQPCSKGSFSLLFNPLTPCSTFLITSYCALHRKDSFCILARRFCVSRKGGTGEVGGITCRVLCTWQLLGLAIKATWLAPGGPILVL